MRVVACAAMVSMHVSTGLSVAVDRESLREVAERLAMEAAAFVRDRRRGIDWSASVRTKSTETDPVTSVDTDCEELVRRSLDVLRPDDAVLGEEGGTGAGRSRVRWVIDPIDGTVNFVYGIPAYAVSIAAQVDGVSVAGAVADVAAGRLFSAAAGQGATVRDFGWSHCSDDSARSGRTLVCNSVSEVRLALVATGFAYCAQRRERQAHLLARLLPRVRDVRRIGSAALDLCAVAEGRVDAQFEHGLGPWDWAAGALIAEEAGAVVVRPESDAPGSAGQFTAAIAPGIAHEFRLLLEEIGALGSIG